MKIKNLFLIALATLQMNSANAIETIVRADQTPGVQTQKDYMIGNGHFEKNVGNWAAYADSAAVTPVDGTGGSPVLTCTRTTSSPLSGVGSFLITKDAANRQGNGCGSTFKIDSTDQARVLEVSFDYAVGSGTFVAGSSSTDSDLEFFIYDVTNSALIPLSTYKVYSNATAPTTTFSGYFQTPSNSTSYRLIAHVATTSTSSWTFKADNIKISRTKYVYGSPITDWKIYTPTFTGFGSAPAPNFFSRRLGDSLEVIGSVSAGTPTAVTAVMTLGYNGVNSNVSVDYGKIGGADLAGDCGSASGSSTTFFRCAVLTSGSAGTVQFGKQTSTVALFSGYALGSDIAQSAQSFHVHFIVPIVGWSSSVQMSDSADTRYIAASYSATNTSASTGAVTNFDTMIYDTHGAVTTGTGTWTFKAPAPGVYSVTGVFETNSVSWSATNSNTITLTKNGSAYKVIGGRVMDANVTEKLLMPFSGEILLNQGDTIQIQTATFQPSTCSGTALNNWIAIKRLSGPSAIAASESVNASYSNTSAQSLSNNSQTAITGWTKIFDSHGAFNATTGIYTCPISGKFRATFQVAFASGYTIDTGNIIAVIQQGGSSTIASASSTVFPHINTQTLSAVTTGTFNCLSGDTLTLSVVQSNGTTRALYSADANWVKFSIEKVGN